MRNVAALVAFSSCLTLAIQAQVTPLPPSSAVDGIVINNGGSNLTNWQSSPLADYQQATGNSFQTPLPNQTDVYGRAWTDQAPDKTLFNQKAGTLRLIFLGTETNWDGGIGYSYNNNPADCYTLAPLASTLSFGNTASILLAHGETAHFDIWLKGGPNTFCLFEPSNGFPSTPNGSITWTRDPLLVSTYLPGIDAYQYVETWIASVDEITNDPANPMLNYRLGVQFYYFEGQPLITTQTPIPEPATYGLFAGGVLIALAFWRRRQVRTT